MSAANVWACIMHYRYDTANELLTAYGSASAIIATLESYPQKDSYHGHISGGAGDGTNQGADQNLDAAIQFLRARKPAVPVQTTKKSEDSSEKGASISKAERLNELIRNVGNLGILQTKLSQVDPKWYTNRVAWSNYSAKYYAKKGSFPQKPK